MESKIYYSIILQIIISYRINAFNITKMSSLTLSKIIMNRHQQQNIVYSVNKDLNAVYGVKSIENPAEIGSILESEISENFKLWHLILIVLFAWILFCK
jgi:hypothetical protein